MKKIIISLSICSILILPLHVFSEEKKENAVKEEHHDEEHEEKDGAHDHANEKYEEGEHEHEEKGEAHDHAKEEGHHEEEEGGGAVGPEKGILEKTENGFRLSPEAMKSFDVKTQPLSSTTSQVPSEAIVFIKDEKFVYRMNNGWIKRIRVQVTRNSSSISTVQLPKIQEGDSIIINGNGFIRAAEISTEEGISHAH